MRSNYFYLRNVSLVSLSILLTFSLFQIPNAFGGDGTVTKNWSVQFNAGTGFRPEISVPPTDENHGAYLVLPPCGGNIKNDCIHSFEALEGNGKWVKAIFKEYLPLKDLKWEDEKFKSYYGNVNDIEFLKTENLRNLPAGGRTGVWDIQSMKHSLGTSYALNVSFPGASTNTLTPRDSGSTINWGSSADRIYANLFPINYAGAGSSCSGSFGKARFQCPNVQEGDFKEFSKFKVSINFLKTKAILDKSRWFSGRLSNSKISESLMKDGSKLLEIEGSPIRVGSVQTEFEKNKANYETLKIANEKYSEITWGNKNELNLTYENFLQATGSGFSTVDPGTLEAWKTLEEKFPFNYISEQGAWGVQSSLIAPDDSDLLSKCSSGSLNPAIISTNAIASNPRPPSWDSKLQELVYTIASPHTRKSGTLNVGVYELSIDERLAACLWGSDSLSYRASIKVESNDGSSKVSTATFVRRDGYLTFRAAGFSYSTSVVKVQLGNKDSGLVAQEIMSDFFPDSVITTKSPIQILAKGAETKKSSINCMKGKVSKKVTAVNPKCPAGFKKK